MLKVSIITVVYNNEASIRDCIESVIKQTYPVEHIIVDGCSTDGTGAIIKEYENKISKWISEKDKGIYDGMNKGIKMSTGDIIGFLNSDDIFYDENVISDIVNSFSAELDCIYGNLLYVSKNDTAQITRRWISRDFKDGLFEKSWTPAHPTFYCRKKYYDQYGSYRLDFKIASDVELMYRFLSTHKIKSRFINRFFVKMRDSGVSNRNFMSTIIITREMKKAIEENGGKFHLVKYLFFKFLKIKEFLNRNKT